MSRLPKKLHLLLSSGIVIVMAFIYGAAPSQSMPIIFQFKVDSIALNYILRAMMGIYLAFGSFWVAGICKERFWQLATITVVLFMGGLVVGRCLSFIIDGWYYPFGLGFIGEAILCWWGIWNLKKYTTKAQL